MSSARRRASDEGQPDGDPDSQETSSIGIAIVRWRDCVLAGKRPSGKPLAGCWEFPGGHVERDELPQSAAIRECWEETGLAVQVVGAFPPVEHAYDHGRVRLYFFACRPVDSHQIPHSPFCWIPLADLAHLRFPEANQEILRQLVPGS